MDFRPTPLKRLGSSRPAFLGAQSIRSGRPCRAVRFQLPHSSHRRGRPLSRNLRFPPSDKCSVRRFIRAWNACLFTIRSYNGDGCVTASVIRINIMRDQAGLKVPRIAYSVGGAAGNVQILWKHELDAFDQNVPAAGIIVRRNSDGLHSPLELFAAWGNLRQNNRQGHPLARTNIFNGCIQRLCPPSRKAAPG